MWPWAHLAVGYVLFSAYERGWNRSRPTQWTVIVLAVATQLPDLIDKPLAWQFNLLQSGVGIAHSLLVGVPVVIGVGLYLRSSGRPGAGAALAIGYVSHVLGDILFGVLFGSPPHVTPFLWPVYSTIEPATAGFVPRVWELLLTSRGLFDTARGRTYFLIQAVLLAATLLLWVRDGMPGLGLWQSAKGRWRRAE